jgi:hypothetical protein
MIWEKEKHKIGEVSSFVVKQPTLTRVLEVK